MAGLLQQGMQQEQQPPRREQQPLQEGLSQPMDESGMRSDPGAQFKPLVEKMLAHLYDKAMPQVERALSAGDPIDSMGRIIGMIMATTYNSLRANGRSVDPPVMVRAGVELTKALGEIAMQMGAVHDGHDDDIETALMLGLAHFGQTANNMPDEEKRHYARLTQGLKEGKKAAQGAAQPVSPGQHPATTQGE